MPLILFCLVFVGYENMSPFIPLIYVSIFWIARLHQCPHQCPCQMLVRDWKRDRNPLHINSWSRFHKLLIEPKSLPIHYHLFRKHREVCGRIRGAMSCPQPAHRHAAATGSARQCTGSWGVRRRGPAAGLQLRAFPGSEDCRSWQGTTRMRPWGKVHLQNCFTVVSHWLSPIQEKAAILFVVVAVC